MPQEEKKKVKYDRIIVFDFTPTGGTNYVYALSKPQTDKCGITQKELNEDLFRLRNREQRRFLTIWDPPHNHLVVAKVDSRKLMNLYKLYNIKH